eukprot:1960605-Rhodomonas_salina.1
MKRRGRRACEKLSERAGSGRKARAVQAHVVLERVLNGVQRCSTVFNGVQRCPTVFNGVCACVRRGSATWSARNGEGRAGTAKAHWCANTAHVTTLVLHAVL